MRSPEGQMESHRSEGVTPDNVTDNQYQTEQTVSHGVRQSHGVTFRSQWVTITDQVTWGQSGFIACVVGGGGEYIVRSSMH